MHTKKFQNFQNQNLQLVITSEHVKMYLEWLAKSDGCKYFVIEFEMPEGDVQVLLPRVETIQ